MAMHLIGEPGSPEARLAAGSSAATADYTPVARRPVTQVRLGVVTAVVACALGVVVSAHEAPAAAPCAACVGLALDASSAGRLVAAGEAAAGLDLLLSPDASASAEGLARVGARLWLETDAAAEWAPPPALAHATGLVVGTKEACPPGGDCPRRVFVVQHTATAARAARPDVRLVLALGGARLSPGDAAALAPYIDAVLVERRAAGSGDGPAPAPAFRGLETWTWSDERDAFAAVLEAAGPTLVFRPADAVRAASTLRALREWMPPGLTPLPDVTVACEGCRSAAWLHPETLQAVALVEGARAGERLRIAPGATRVDAVDVEGGGPPVRLEPAGQVAAVVRAPATASGGPLVLAIAGWRGGDEEIYRTGVEVTAARTLTVEEVIARHQAQRARQAAVVQTVIATGTTVLTFEVPGFPAPVTVTAETSIYTRGALTEVAQTAIRVNGMDMAADGRAPRVPIVDAERVSTPPLTITLTAAYRYELAGRDRRTGRDAYVVAFSPVGAEEPSFRGRAWIDAATFALLRMEAAQTGLRGPIVSSEQHDAYVPVRVGDRDVWLVGRSSSFQVYQAAGLRTPIHREVVTPAHVVNAPDFETRLDAAHASRAVMLRDTPQGYRYLVPGRDDGPGDRRVVAERAGQRVVTGAFGVLIDPNITVPLPYAGVSYLDFDFLQKGIQLSGFFGGAYGHLAWTVPRFVRPGWQLTGRVFGIGVSYNDRAFQEGREQYQENILQRPFRSDVALVAPLSPRVQARLGYAFEYTAFRAGTDTAPGFVVPSDGVVHALRVGLDAQRGPWSGQVWWSPARRQGWTPWGWPGPDAAAAIRSYQRYGATLARAWVMAPGAVARVEASWMEGRDLDRFSRFTVDNFENRLRGYPSASLRYDRGGVLRSVAAWAPVERLRLDVFADYALVRDPGFGPGLRSYPGLGGAVELPLPQRMLVAVEWGYGVNARNVDGSRGTHVVRVSGVKVF
jgi:hypothetical protein